MVIEGIEYKYLIESFGDLIYDGLNSSNDRLLRGIQTFDVSTFSHLEGIESVLSVMFALTVDGKIEADDLERRLKDDKDYYEKTGTLEKMKERLKRKKNGEIPFFFIKNACSGLKSVVKNLFLLKEHGYIEIIGKDIDNSFLKLTSKWEKFIEDTIKRGYEAEIYGSSISRMIASGILQKGFRLIFPIASALMIAEKSKGELKLEKFKQLFEDSELKYRHFTNVIERDQKKPKDIQLIHHLGDKKVIFNTASIYAIKQWINLAEKLKLKIGRTI